LSSSSWPWTGSDVVVAGSLSVARGLMERGLVEEDRLLVFPTVAGEGERLFDGTRPPSSR